MIVRDEGGGRVVVEVQIAAPAEAVWAAITKPEEIERWFPLQAQGDGALGGVIEISWGDERWWGLRVVEAQPGEHLRLAEAAEPPEPATTRLFVDYHLESRGGATLVRLVHSGFGPGEEWDEWLEGLDAGWGFFLRNLKLYLERHPRLKRTMAWARPVVTGSRAAIWSALLGTCGIQVDPSAILAPGTPCDVRLGDDDYHGIVEVVVPGRTLAVLLPTEADTLVFLEVEGEGEGGKVGIWISVYRDDGGRAAKLQRGADAAGAELVRRLGS